MTAPPPFDPWVPPSNPQQLRRPDWDQSNYWVQPPRRIPPSPAFSAYVPAPDNIAFAQATRDQNTYRIPQTQVTQQQTLPARPPIVGFAPPQHPPRYEWALRDYSANQSYVGPQATPIPPIVSGPLFPQQNPRPDWTLAQYAANQQWLAPLLYVAPAAVVVIGDSIGFGELPRDMTAYFLASQGNRFTVGLVQAVKPKAFTQVVPQYRERDNTAERLVIDFNRPTYLAPPMVPIGEVFSSFDYEPLDMTPYNIALQRGVVPASRIPFVFPNPVPYVQPPGWTLSQYQQIQDQISAILTPAIPVYPPGLKPYFPIEALIRDVPRATLLVQNFILPPPPPKPRPTPPVYVEWQDWNLSQYQQIQDQFSAWASLIPIATGFRVTAVTCGMYGGQFYNPGDVFDINFASEYSDSTINYQFNAGETVYGWMLRVSPGTPLTTYEITQIYFSPPDPKRKFIM